MSQKKTKKEIVSALAEKHAMTQVQVSKVLHGFFEEVMIALEGPGVIELRNFGVFKVKKRKPRKARNPRNNKEVEVGERYVVTFRAGREMSERVNNAQNDRAKQSKSDTDKK